MPDTIEYWKERAHRLDALINQAHAVLEKAHGEKNETYSDLVQAIERLVAERDSLQRCAETRGHFIADVCAPALSKIADRFDTLKTKSHPQGQSVDTAGRNPEARPVDTSEHLALRERTENLNETVHALQEELARYAALLRDVTQEYVRYKPGYFLRQMATEMAKDDGTRSWDADAIGAMRALANRFEVLDALLNARKEKCLVHDEILPCHFCAE